MATQITVKTTEIEKVEIGHIAISLSHWDDNLEPEIAIGSVFELGGSLYQVQGANDDIDAAGAWGGFGINTLVYIYYAAGAGVATAELSSVAPVWDTAKQDWMNAALTKRCIGSIYKDAGGNYTQKTIFKGRHQAIIYNGLNLGIGVAAGRTIRFTQLVSIGWDHTNQKYTFDNYLINRLNSYKTNAGGADQLLLTIVGTTGYLDLKKPISAYIKDTLDTGSGNISIYQNGGWVVIATLIGAGVSPPLQLNPGRYRLVAVTTTLYLYTSGAFGTDDLSRTTEIV